MASHFLSFLFCQNEEAEIDGLYLGRKKWQIQIEKFEMCLRKEVLYKGVSRGTKSPGTEQ